MSQTITVPTVGQNQGFAAVQGYTYDSLNRLKSAAESIGGNQSWKQTFTFDRYGNRRFDEANTTTIPQGCRMTVCNPTIDPATNKLIGYQFDNSGNTKQDAENRKFTYDAENKQVKVETLDGNGNVTGTIGEYSYDGDGKRVKKYVPSTGETTVFVYDASGKLVAEYSTVVTPPQDAKVSYLTNDTLGSPRITTDQNGQTISRRDFLPFGEEALSPQRTQPLGYTPDTIRQKFTGYERDNETDLDFAQARMYGYSHGRFTSPDLVAGKRINPQTLNMYVYVTNNPLKYVDPSGYCGTTAGSPDKTPCLWYKNADGNYMSVSRQQFGDGSGYAGYSLVEDRETVYFQLTTLNGDYANDAEYQALAQNQSFVGLGANGRFVGLPGDPVAVGAEEDVPDGTTQVPPGNGYFDFNLTGGHYGFVATGGLQVDSNLNLFPYVGGGVGTPGVGWSFGYSPDSVTPGPNAQIQVTPIGTVGVDRKKNSFTEFNVGPPGASATVIWVFGKDDGTVPPRFPTGPNAKVNSPLDYKRPIAPNCSCNVSVPR